MEVSEEQDDYELEELGVSIEVEYHELPESEEIEASFPEQDFSVDCPEPQSVAVPKSSKTPFMGPSGRGRRAFPLASTNNLPGFDRPPVQTPVESPGPDEELSTSKEDLSTPPSAERTPHKPSAHKFPGPSLGPPLKPVPSEPLQQTPQTLKCATGVPQTPANAHVSKLKVSDFSPKKVCREPMSREPKQVEAPPSFGKLTAKSTGLQVKKAIDVKSSSAVSEPLPSQASLSSVSKSIEPSSKPKPAKKAAAGKVKGKKGKRSKKGGKNSNAKNKKAKKGKSGAKGKKSNAAKEKKAKKSNAAGKLAKK